MALLNPALKDSLGRRSRYKRQPTGKRIILSNRDIELFKLLYRYRYLRADRILKWFSPCSKNRLIERLGDLYHECYFINRIEAQWNGLNAGMMPFAYELTKNGLNALLEQDGNLLLPDPAVSHAGVRPHETRLFHHALEISHTLFDLELSLRKSKTQRILFETEILSKASERLGRKIQRSGLPVTIPCSAYMPRQRAVHITKALPDALFAVETIESGKPLYRFYALEVELKSPLIRRTPEKTSTLKKLLAYQQILNSDTARKTLSLPNLYVIFSTDSVERLCAIKDLSEQVWSAEERNRLLLKPLDQSGNSFVEISQKWREHFQP